MFLPWTAAGSLERFNFTLGQAEGYRSVKLRATGMISSNTSFPMRAVIMAAIPAVVLVTLAAAQVDPIVRQAESCGREDGSAVQQRIAACTAIIRSDRLTPPNRALALIHRGNAYAAERQYGQAITDYDEAIKLNAPDDSAYIQRAIANRAMGNLDAAIADYGEAIRLKPRPRHRLCQPRRRLSPQGRSRSRNCGLQPGDPARRGGRRCSGRSRGGLQRAQGVWPRNYRLRRGRQARSG